MRCPGGLSKSKSDTDFSRDALEEVLLQNKFNSLSNDAAAAANNNTAENNNIDDENQSTSSIFSSSTSTTDENGGIILELAIKNFEQDLGNNKSIPKSTSYNCQIPQSTSSSSLNRLKSPDSSPSGGSFSSARVQQQQKEAATFLNDSHFRNGLKLLREQLLQANALAREANALCKEINRPIRFSITMQIPAYNLTPFRKVGFFEIRGSTKNKFTIFFFYRKIAFCLSRPLL